MNLRIITGPRLRRAVVVVAVSLTSAAIVACSGRTDGESDTSRGFWASASTTDTCLEMPFEAAIQRQLELVGESMDPNALPPPPYVYNADPYLAEFGFSMDDTPVPGASAPADAAPDAAAPPPCRCPEVTIRCKDPATPTGPAASCSYNECVVTMSLATCTKLGYADGDKKKQTDLEAVPLKDSPVRVSDIIATCTARHESEHACQSKPTDPKSFNCNEQEGFTTSQQCWQDALTKYCAPPVPANEQLFCDDVKELANADLGGKAYTSCRCAGNDVQTCARACVDALADAGATREQILDACRTHINIYK